MVWSGFDRNAGESRDKQGTLYRCQIRCKEREVRDMDVGENYAKRAGEKKMTHGRGRKQLGAWRGVG